MYKEALIRNTYQGILANRPRDLTEEEEEALALAKVMEGAEVNGKSAEEAPGEGGGSAVVVAKPAFNHPPLGLPPLSGGARRGGCDSPASKSTHAPSTPQQQPWRASPKSTTSAGSVPLNTQSRGVGALTPSSLSTMANSVTTNTMTVEAFVSNREVAQSYSYAHTATNNTEEGGSVLSWVADCEDEFYDQLEMEPSLSEQYNIPSSRTNTMMEDSFEEGGEDKRRGNRRRNHDHNYSVSEINHRGAGGHKGGRTGKKRAGGNAKGSSTNQNERRGMAATSKAGRGGGNNTNNTAQAGQQQAQLSSGRFESLRR